MRRVEIGKYTNSSGKTTWNIHEDGTLVVQASENEAAQRAMAERIFSRYTGHAVLAEWDGDHGILTEIKRK